jgi:hypothetical protein
VSPAVPSHAHIGIGASEREMTAAVRARFLQPGARQVVPCVLLILNPERLKNFHLLNFFDCRQGFGFYTG